MNGRWKEGGLIIELFKTTRACMRFDIMNPSGSSLVVGVKVQRVMDHAHSAIEPGKKISMSKFHQITGYTGEHLLRPTAKSMKIELTGKLAPYEICAQAEIRQVNIPKKNEEITNHTCLLILTATPLTVIRRLRQPSSNPSHWHTK